MDQVGGVHYKNCKKPIIERMGRGGEIKKEDLKVYIDRKRTILSLLHESINFILCIVIFFIYIICLEFAVFSSYSTNTIQKFHPWLYVWSCLINLFKNNYLIS